MRDSLGRDGRDHQLAMLAFLHGDASLRRLRRERERDERPPMQPSRYAAANAPVAFGRAMPRVTQPWQP